MCVGLRELVRKRVVSIFPGIDLCVCVCVDMCLFVFLVCSCLLHARHIDTMMNVMLNKT